MKEIPGTLEGQKVEAPEAALRAALIETGKVERFIDAAPYTPEPLQEDTPRLVQTGIELIDEYFSHHIVIDTEGAFAGHRARRVWRTELPLSQREVYENNALRRNLVGVALSAAEIVIKTILTTERGQTLKEEYDALLKEFESGWKVDEEHPDGAFSIEEKIAYVEEQLKPFLLQVRAAAYL